MTATVAELAVALDTSEDDRLVQAEALVRSWCGWHIAPSRTEDLTVDGPGGFSVVLPTLYLTDVTQVTEDGDVVDDSFYYWSQAGFLRCVGDSVSGHLWRWTDHPRGLVVSVVHGYPEVPAEVTRVVQALADRLDKNPSGLLSKTVGPFSETYSGDGLFGMEMDALAKYRLPARP